MKVNSYKLLMVRDSSVKLGDMVSCASDVNDVICKYLEGADREHFVVVALNTKNAVIGINTCHIGTLDMANIHPREVFKFALLSNAHSIIIAHNHPSGDISPSREDIALTNLLIEAGNIMCVKVLDHVIVGDGNYYSMQQHQSVDFGTLVKGKGRS